MEMEVENIPKKQFDDSSGDTQLLPEYLNIMRFAESRAKEVKGMINALAQSNGTKLIFQQLPKHMRRRTMSHKVKRVPQKLREGHLNQLQKSGMPVKTKRPSRKWRRKPSNLFCEYNCRQRKFAWLETHIWHAKRFHMVEKWGYKLPKRSCDKTFRFCYRASSKHCLLQDISYYSCVAISGDQNVLIEGFKSITNPLTGLGIGARAYVNSQREGSCIIYNKGKYPFGAIGEITFVWKPSADTSRVVWLWAHPAVHSELVKNLLEVFELSEHIENKPSKIFSNNSTKVSLKVLKNEFNRFRLTGPLSNAVLQNALKPPLPNNKTPWFDEYLNSDDNRQIFFDQCNFWESLKNTKSPSEINPHLVINLIVSDPRYNFPHKRSKAKPEENVSGEILEVCSSLKYGEIWECMTRKIVSENKMSTSQFLKERMCLLVPEDSVPDKAYAVPVMLIQRPGVKNNSGFLGYGTGWDIILPAGWGLPFWLCLIMWGAKPGGLRESESIQYEMGLDNILPPDTSAGDTEEKHIIGKYKDKFFRLPPAKRTNYSKFGICCPFDFPWKKIIEEWNPSRKSVKNFYILRDRKQLNSLQDLLVSKHQNKINLLNNINLKLTENCLIPIRLRLTKRGRITKFATICLPEESDFKKNSATPTEIIHDDPNKQKRKELRKKHQLLLKQLRRRRVRAKKKGKVLPKPVELVQKHAQEMRKLWLPEPTQPIKDSCIRKIMGFVTKGDVSFVTGQGLSIGYVPVGVLKDLLSRSQVDKVLVRNTCTRKYRFAKLEVICR